MRVRLLAAVPLMGLVAWVGANALLSAPTTAEAQAPTIVLGRAQKAGYLPRPGSKRPIVILAIGSDARPGQRVSRLRADAIQLITINPKKGAGTILGFPRDSYVPIPGLGTRKINDSMVYGGPELVVRTVQNLTGIRIDYWMLTSFKGLSRMVDRIGGISLRIRYPMNDSFSGTNFSPGKKKLSGGQALAFTRDRHSAPGGDFGRSANQGRLLHAALRKYKGAFQREPATLLRWIRVGLGNVQTDLSLPELIDLGLLAAQVKPAKVRTLVAPGSTGSAGGASIVLLSGSAQAIYRDMKDDGILNR